MKYKNRIITAKTTLKPRKLYHSFYPKLKKYPFDFAYEPRAVVYYYEQDHLEDWPLDIYQSAKKFLKDMKVIYIGKL